MAEVKYSWPENHKTRLIGKRVNRLDGMVKSVGNRQVHLRCQPAQSVDRARSRLSARALQCDLRRYFGRRKSSRRCFGSFDQSAGSGR